MRKSTNKETIDEGASVAMLSIDEQGKEQVGAITNEQVVGEAEGGFDDVNIETIADEQDKKQGDNEQAVDVPQLPPPVELAASQIEVKPSITTTRRHP